MRIGILGGTFNPIHASHMRTAVGAREALSLDRVLLMVAADPPHKTVAGAVPAEIRYRMAALAAAGAPGVEASDLEVRRQGKSYTVETLRTLRAEHPEAELFLIVGSDMLRDLPRWYCPEGVLSLATLAAVPRKGFERDDAAAAELLRTRYNAKVVPLPVYPDALSSTEVRERLYGGRPVTGLLPAAVEQYVYETGLYFPENVRRMQETCRSAVNSKRYLHIMAVVRRAAALAERYGVDPEKARLAALLHDCAKCMDKRRLAVLSGDDYEIEPVLHAFAGAVVAHNDYGVTDQKVLRAIRLHSTGDAKMDELSMLTYLADITGDDRDFPGALELRAASEEGLAQGMYQALTAVENLLEQRNLPVHPASMRAIAYFKNLLQEETH